MPPKDPENIVRDYFKRPLRDLRISVMDRCNLRCAYCMPEETFHDNYQFLSPQERLSFDEIEEITKIAASMGVVKLRLTGGEPLLRKGLNTLIERLVKIEGIEDIALTTNGILLQRYAQELKDAGLNRVSVSLDAMSQSSFEGMSGGRGKLSQVLEGIEAAQKANFPGGIKVNAVIQKGVNDDQIIPLAAYFRETNIILRFIEYMDVGTRNSWSMPRVMSSDDIRGLLEERWALEPLGELYKGEVADRYRYKDGKGEVGFISSVSTPFCGDCSRVRLSSEGKIYTCLFADSGFDLRPFLKEKNTEKLKAFFENVWHERKDRYSLDRKSLLKEDGKTHRKSAIDGGRRIEMNYIGG
ncbi:GTP 3',8-cyclase MoaA [Acetobacteraceae bacterium]|nr:GTP 3',8-cyclase MoaA [Acetobacteraceae bacterium]